MLDPTKFKPNRDTKGGDQIDEWFCGVDDRDIEVLVRGSNEGPDSQSLSMADEVLQHFDKLTEKALSLLQEFIKDRGTWTLSGVNCGLEAQRQQCDFLLSFGFEAEGDPWRDTKSTTRSDSSCMRVAPLKTATADRSSSSRGLRTPGRNLVA